MGIYPLHGHICHRKNIASISVGAEWGGGACAGTTGSRRFSIVLRSVGAERGGGACAGTAGSRYFSIVSRLAKLTEGAVTAATTCSVGTKVSSFTTHRTSLLRRWFSHSPGISVCMALPHSTPVDDISKGSIRRHTIQVSLKVSLGDRQWSGRELNGF